MDQHSVQQPLLKVGDEVRFTVSKNPGFVKAVERHDVLGETCVVYKIKIPYGAIRTAKPDDIEPLED